jgi:hypothetical protein
MAAFAVKAASARKTQNTVLFLGFFRRNTISHRAQPAIPAQLRIVRYNSMKKLLFRV